MSLGESFTDTGKDLEFCVCINKTGTQNRPLIGVSNNYTAERPYFGINSMKLYFKIRSNIILISNYTIAQNTWYKYIFKRINGIYTISVYDTNNNLLNNTSLESSALIGNGVSQNFAFGYDKANYNTSFNGSIDLENTYIKVGQNYLMRGYLTDNDRLIATNKGWGITG